MVAHRNEINNANAEKLQKRISERFSTDKQNLAVEKEVYRNWKYLIKVPLIFVQMMLMLHLSETILRSPRSMKSAARDLDTPVSTLHKVIRKRLHTKIQIIQAFEPDDRPRRMDLLPSISFARHILPCNRHTRKEDRG